MKIKIHPGILSWLISFVYRVLMLTVRVRVENDGPIRRIWEGGKPVVMACWHNELFALPSLPIPEGSGWVAIVSASSDGEILARFLNRLGIETARGSSSRKGLSALRHAVRAMEEGQGTVNGFVTVDGPRGPRHKVKDGVLFMANKASAPLVPVRVLYSRKYVFEKAWDKFEVPMPFSSCRVVFGEPYPLGEGPLRGEALRKERSILEAKLNGLG